MAIITLALSNTLASMAVLYTITSHLSSINLHKNTGNFRPLGSSDESVLRWLNPDFGQAVFIRDYIHKGLQQIINAICPALIVQHGNN